MLSVSGDADVCYGKTVQENMYSGWVVNSADSAVLPDI